MGYDTYDVCDIPMYIMYKNRIFVREGEQDADDLSSTFLTIQNNSEDALWVDDEDGIVNNVRFSSYTDEDEEIIDVDPSEVKLVADIFDLIEIENIEDWAVAGRLDHKSDARVIRDIYYEININGDPEFLINLTGLELTLKNRFDKVDGNIERVNSLDFFYVLHRENGVWYEIGYAYGEILRS